ncbi:MAG: hypothetical protein MJ215_02440 [Spirochaetia bacterium]|nr:hypothetical protein [Spirochaetia bacterium]
MTREDFVFTIGYDGECAVIDKKARKQYGNLKTEELFDIGLVKASVRSAVFSKDPDEKRLVLEKYNGKAGRSAEDFSQLQSFFGVTDQDLDSASAIGKSILL